MKPTPSDSDKANVRLSHAFFCLCCLEQQLGQGLLVMSGLMYECWDSEGVTSAEGKSQSTHMGCSQRWPSGLSLTLYIRWWSETAETVVKPYHLIHAHKRHTSSAHSRIPYTCSTHCLIWWNQGVGGNIWRFSWLLSFDRCGNTLISKWWRSRCLDSKCLVGCQVWHRQVVWKYKPQHFCLLTQIHLGWAKRHWGCLYVSLYFSK